MFSLGGASEVTLLVSWMEDIRSLTFLRLINSSLPSGSLTRPLGTLSHVDRSFPRPPHTSAGTLHWECVGPAARLPLRGGGGLREG